MAYGASAIEPAVVIRVEIVRIWLSLKGRSKVGMGMALGLWSLMARRGTLARVMLMAAAVAFVL